MKLTRVEKLPYRTSVSTELWGFRSLLEDPVFEYLHPETKVTWA